MYWSKPTTVGTGHTVTANGFTIIASVFFTAFSGANLTPFDQEVNNASSAAPGSITPAAANSLFMTFLGISSTVSSSIDLGFTVIDQILYNGGTRYGGALAYKVQAGGPTAQAPTWSGGGATPASKLVTFKP